MNNKLINASDHLNNVIVITTGKTRGDIKKFCDIAPAFDRSKFKFKEFDAWSDREPRFDREGLLDSIELLPTRAETHEKLFNDIQLIIEKYLWPPKGLALVLFDEKNKPVLFGGAGPGLPYSVTLDDFKLNKKNSIAAYSLEKDMPLFLYNITHAEEDTGILKLEGEPIMQDYKFPLYTCFEQNEVRKFDRSLVTKAVLKLSDVVLIPLVKNGKKLGVLFVGMDFPFFDNLEKTWYLKILGISMISSLELISIRNKGSN